MRYSLQPMDTVQYQHRKYLVKGVQNKGAYVKLEGLAKPVKVEQVTLVKYGKGFHMTAPIHPLPTPVGA